MKFHRVWAEVEPIAVDLVANFRAQDVVCEVGGSFRRRAQMVGDLDIVVQADSLSEIVLPDICFERLGEKVSHGVLDLGGQSFGVDIWCATPRQWGAFMWFITGSKELNIKMRSMAKAQGLKLSQFGLFRDGVQIDDGSEKSVSDLLGLGWIEPADRQKFVKPDRVPDQVFEVASSSGEGFYVVKKTDSVWSCSCPHNRFRKVECKHIVKVRKAGVVAA